MLCDLVYLFYFDNEYGVYVSVLKENNFLLIYDLIYFSAGIIASWLYLLPSAPTNIVDD